MTERFASVRCIRRCGEHRAIIPSADIPNEVFPVGEAWEQIRISDNCGNPGNEMPEWEKLQKLTGQKQKGKRNMYVSIMELLTAAIMGH